VSKRSSGGKKQFEKSCRICEECWRLLILDCLLIC